MSLFPQPRPSHQRIDPALTLSVNTAFSILLVFVVASGASISCYQERPTSIPSVSTGHLLTERGGRPSIVAVWPDCFTAFWNHAFHVSRPGDNTIPNRRDGDGWCMLLRHVLWWLHSWSRRRRCGSLGYLGGIEQGCGWQARLDGRAVDSVVSRVFSCLSLSSLVVERPHECARP
ncbi:hypothetical protein R3P38DRAFT_3070394 [Favolaschia claudopus]|uniref:Uncharacterized protein n=1 Tax=Favolaschia claudopus TaxID=2862362 RepID=A0AAV9ZZW6_9AGAR